MKLKKLTKVALVLSLVGGAPASMAASTAAFDIVPLVGQSGLNQGFVHGPFAVSLGTGKDPAVVSRYLKNDVFTFFNLAPQQFNDGDRVLHITYCYYYLDQDVCDGYWDGANKGKDWRYDLVYGIPQVSSVLNGSIFNDAEITYESIAHNDGSSEEGVGSIAGDRKQYGYRELSGIAKFDNKKFILKSPYYSADKKDNYGDYAQAFSYYKLDDGRVLVGGMSYNGHFNEDIYNYCYGGSFEADENDYLYCPGFRTQATIWIVDPKNMQDGQVVKGVQPAEFFDADADSSRLTYANVRGFTKVGDKIFAVGHSLTDEFGGTIFSGAMSVYWPLTFDATDTLKVKFDNNGIGFAGVERPGKGDDENLYIDAKAVNAKGYVALNRKMYKSVNSNYPKEFMISLIKQDGSSTSAIYPFHDKPIKGANSEAADLNDNGLVVGWRDARYENSPVNYGIARNQTGFIYNINDNTSYYLNDLICKTVEGEKDCSVNGRYYAIAWPVAINNDNVILATAFEYPSYSAWENMTDAKVVNVLLKPNSATFKTITPEVKPGEQAQDYITIDDSLVVSNIQYLSFNSPSHKEGRGALDIFGLMLLAFGGFIFKRRIFKRKK